MLGPSLSVNGGITSVERLILEQKIPNVNFVHIPIFEEGRPIRKLVVFLLAVFALIRRCLSGTVDVVHLHISQRGSIIRQSFSFLIASAFRKSVILHAHGSEFAVFYAQLPAFAKILLSQIFRRSRYLIVLSESWKNFYSQSFNLDASKVAVLTNPVRLPDGNSSKPTNERVTFLFLGRIGQRKGIFDLVNAFARLPIEIRAKSRLLVAGDGEIETVRSMLSTLGVEDSVELLGWIDTQERDRLLSLADVFVLPSYNEGWPMALLEAMGWRLPVITTPVGGIPELITHKENGLLLEPGDISQLVDLLTLLVESSELRKSLGLKARSSVEHLDISYYSNRLSKLYHSSI